MMETQLRISPDIPVAIAILVVLVIVASAGQFCLATYRRSLPKFVLVLGVSAHLALVTALLRPTIQQRQSRQVGPRVAILVDASRRLRLASHGQSRAKTAEKAVTDLLRKFASARADLMVFGDDGPRLLTGAAQLPNAMTSSEGSDLTSALNALTETVGEPPAAVVLVTDGRLTRPESTDAASREFAQSLKGIPIYGVDVGGAAIPDASIRSVSGLGHAVAHQSFSLRVDVTCGGGLTCQRVPVYVREFERGRKSRELAQSSAELSGRDATVLDINIAFERAGTHILKISLAPQTGDQVPENDSRYLVFNVARERVRLLHIAGSPSYDVRELRRWLKGNASVDLVSFFILRTDDDDTNTAENSGELALIPFPVDELFDRHLSSFDGVILQDIDAARYHLDVHLDQLARYVEEGGGLVLAGGPAAFSGGAYAHSALERVLPTSIVVTRTPFDSVDFIPSTTPVGLEAPILAPMRRLLGERLPSFPGANTLGPPKPDARVLWVHPTRTFLPVRGQSVAVGPMPVLAIREVNEGRTVALGLDATYRFAWGAVAVESSGRAYGAFWEAIIGWVMHEARFEPFRGDLKSPCVVGIPPTLKWTIPRGTKGELSVDIERMDTEGLERREYKVELAGNGDVEVKLGDLVAGAYTAIARINGGLAARLDFFCEEGGAALADSRPDPERLRLLTSVTGGRTVDSEDINALPVPPNLLVDESRTSKPVGPAWFWSLTAATLLGATWLSARRYGMR